MSSFLKVNRQNLPDVVIVVVLFATAFIWKFLFIGVRDVCIDEPFTIFNAQKGLKEILLLPTQNEPNPPLFMFILHFWVKWFGISAATVRIVPLFFNALTPVFLYLTGKKLSNHLGGMVAAGLFILSSYQFYFGMETRTYSLLLCATAATLYYLFSLLKNPSGKGYLAGLILTNIILVYSHYFGWFVVFMEFVTGLLYLKNREAFKKIFLAVVVAGIAFIPMAVTFVRQFFISKEQTWVKPPERSAYWRELILFLNNPLVIKVVVVVLLVGLVVFLTGKNKKLVPLDLAAIFLFWLLPYTLMFFVSSKVPMFENRYVMYNSIGLYLNIGFLTGLFYSRWKFLLPVASAVILLTMGLKMQTNLQFIAYRETQKAVHFVKERHDASMLTLVYPHWNDYEFAYYFNQEIFKDVTNFEPRLRDSMVYQVWGLDDAKNYIEKFRDKNILFFRGGNGYKEINNYLDSLYLRTDSVYFPDCYYIYSYRIK